jgi:hypothetical protein
MKMHELCDEYLNWNEITETAEKHCKTRNDKKNKIQNFRRPSILRIDPQCKTETYINDISYTLHFFLLKTAAILCFGLQVLNTCN